MANGRFGVLFGPAVTRWVRSVLIAIPLIIVGGLLVLMFAVRANTATGQDAVVEQPVQFDHRHHVDDAGIDCQFCHQSAAHAAHAGMPPAGLCMRCHNQVLADAELLEPVRTAYEAGEAIPWQRVNEVADHAFFHHGVHVQAGVDCAHCHGEVDRMPAVNQARPLTMGWCLDCHRHPEGVELIAVDDGPITCSSCHR